MEKCKTSINSEFISRRAFVSNCYAITKGFEWQYTIDCRKRNVVILSEHKWNILDLWSVLPNLS